MKLDLTWRRAPEDTEQGNLKATVEIDLQDFRTAREFERFFESAWSEFLVARVPLTSHIIWLGWWQALRDNAPGVPLHYEASLGRYCWVDALSTCVLVPLDETETAGESPLVEDNLPQDSLIADLTES